jgi:AcrR family transcriptional regulator
MNPPPASKSTPPAAAATESRRYRSTRRDQQAAQTRHDVLMGAVRLFDSTGWSGTTMAAIAAEAGVAVETIYSGFGNKKQLLRAAMDVAIVGDTAPIPLADRPEWARMGVGTFDERVRAGISLQGATHERGAAIWMALRDAAETDDEVATWCADMERTRRSALRESLAMITDRTFEDDELLDVLWALMGPEVYVKLVRERGWSREQWEQHIADATSALIR